MEPVWRIGELLLDTSSNVAAVSSSRDGRLLIYGSRSHCQGTSHLFSVLRAKEFSKGKTTRASSRSKFVCAGDWAPSLLPIMHVAYAGGELWRSVFIRVVDRRLADLSVTLMIH